MRGIWTEKDIQGGVAVTREVQSGYYSTPNLIGWLQASEPPNKNILALIDIADGFVQTFINESTLAEFLTKLGYVPCVKIITGAGKVEAIPDNRLSMPMIMALHSQR